MRPIIVLLLFAAPVTAATQDFTTWTEVDPATYYAVDANTVTATAIHRDMTGYVYYDFGVSNFEDVNCTFETTLTAMNRTDGLCYLGAVLFTNGLNDWYGVGPGGGVNARAFCVYWGRNTSGYYLGLWHEATQTVDRTADSSIYLSLSTPYTCHLTRDADGGANSTGQWVLAIEDDGTPVDTLTIDVPAGQQAAFRYIEVCASEENSSSGVTASGSVSLLELLTTGGGGGGGGTVNGPYYVSPSGSNDNDGNTPSEAWATLEYALETGHPTSDANDIIYLLTGDYNDVLLDDVDVNSTSWDDSFLITVGGDQEPNITSLTISGTTQWINMVAIPITQADVDVYGRSALNIQTSHVKFSGTITGDWDTEEADDMTTYGVYLNGNVATIEDVNLHDCTITQCNWGVMMVGDLQGNIVVKDCVFEEINQSAVSCDSDEDQNDILVEYCTRCVQTFAKVDSTKSGPPHGAGITIRTSNVTLRGNVVTAYGGSGGIRGYDNNSESGYRNLLIENNIMYGNNVSEAFKFFDLEGNIVIRNNLLQCRQKVDPSFDPQRYIGVWALALYSADANGISFSNNIVLGNGELSPTVAEVVDVNSNLLWSVYNGSSYLGSLGNNIIICAGDNNYNEGYTSTWLETPTYLFVGSPTFADYFSYGGSVQSDYTVFRTIGGSVVVDAGDASNAPTIDITGAARDASPDIGPYEYIQTGTPTRRILIRRL